MLFAQSLDRNGELLVLWNSRLEARAFGKAALEAATTEGQKAREEEKSEKVDVELIALPDSLSHRLLRFIHTLNVCNSFVILCVAIEGLDHWLTLEECLVAVHDKVCDAQDCQAESTNIACEVSKVDSEVDLLLWSQLSCDAKFEIDFKIALVNFPIIVCVDLICDDGILNAWPEEIASHLVHLLFVDQKSKLGLLILV